MKAVFADTSFLFAVVIPDDVWHLMAVEAGEIHGTRILLTEFVLLELGNTMRRGLLRSLYLNLVRAMRNDPSYEIVPASSALIQQGMELFAKRPDKEWSLTDCISFVVMRNQGLTDALATDKHFEQAGFRILLK
ncbi:MAG: type II toxin-antitoxin system VapC family toxin [Phycisphaerae bacterium]